MPVHNWTIVEAGIFHDFHHAWIEEIKRALNAGLLPPDHYAMAEQQAGAFGPDVLTLQSNGPASEATDTRACESDDGGGLLLAPPKVELTAEADLDYYRRKQNTVTVRHVSGDRVVAVVEIISRGNKSGHAAMRSLVEKTSELLLQGVHLLLIDLHPPGRRDPHGLHGLIWDDVTGQSTPKPSKPLTLAAYESGAEGAVTRAYVQPIAVGDSLPDMPLFLRPGAHVPLPLETTYSRAFAAMPKRWRSVLETA